MQIIARQPISTAKFFDGFLELAFFAPQRLCRCFFRNNLPQKLPYQRRHGRVALGRLGAGPPIGGFIHRNCDILHSYTVVGTIEKSILHAAGAPARGTSRLPPRRTDQ